VFSKYIPESLGWDGFDLWIFFCFFVLFSGMFMYESQKYFLFCFVLVYGLPTSVLLKSDKLGMGRGGQNRGRCLEGETKPSMEE